MKKIEKDKIEEINNMINFLSKERDNYINKFSIKDLFCDCNDKKYSEYSDIILFLYEQINYIKNKNYENFN